MTLPRQGVNEAVSEGLGGRVLLSPSDDVEALCLMKECRELEGGFRDHIYGEAGVAGVMLQSMAT